MSDGDAADGSPSAAAVPEPGDAERQLFGDRIGPARTYAALLADAGVREGHIGPREVPRLWERHLVNSALLADLVAPDARVVDVGSGAGLPGVVLAIRRPDLRVDLVEPMLRRTRFLDRVVTELELSEQVRVVRGRAEERDVVALVGRADVVVARAVAPLDRLVGWCLPLLRPGGLLLALKGSSAAEELATHRAAVRAAGGESPEVLELPGPIDVTWVVSVRAGRQRGRRP